MLTEAN